LATIEGYSEEAVDALEAEFAQVIQASIVNVLARTANSLQPAIVAAVDHPFHLPGKHDQSTHGRSRQRPVTVMDPYRDWGGNGKQPWMASHDPHVRAVGMWSESYEGQAGIRETMRGLHRGELAPEQDVPIEGALKGYASSFHYDTNEKYGDARVRDDLFNAASHLDQRLADAPVVHTTLYRGMSVSNPGATFKVGDTFDSDISSWTTSSSTASAYTSRHMGLGKPADGKPVIMRVTGAKALDLDDGSMPKRLQGSGEHLVRGTFKITAVETNGDETTVTVEQLWQTA
jgi:hypothetical protein